MNRGWETILKAIAPSISGAIGGPLAGMAVSAAAEILLPAKGRPNTPQDLFKAVVEALPIASPEEIMRLQVADGEFKIRLATLRVEMERIHKGDRQSARNREREIGGVTTPILGILVVLGFLAVVICLIARGLPADIGKEGLVIIGTMIGYLSSKADQIIGYYFGSSSETKVSRPLK